jgi:hypothetical protein
MSPPPSADAPRELGGSARAAGVVAWSAFLAAALATMLCFAMIDPLALGAGDSPSWWTTRLHVYAIGFFFFWFTGLIAAGLCWVLARHGR